MNKFNSNCATIALGASLALLSACGGGGDGGSSGGSGGGGNGGGGGTGGSGGGGTGGGGTGLSVQGGFGGTINLTKGNRFEMIVLEDGTFWTMYGNATNGVVDVVGFIEGTSTQDTQAHTFASGDSHDFGLTPVAATTLAGAYSAKSISGTIAYSASSQPTFSGSPIPTHQYDYDAAATVADAQGSWAMVSLTGVQTTLNVASDGTFVGSDVGGCSLGGSLVPRASGKNVFDLALQFGATCPKGATAYNGIALLTHVSGGSQLVLAAIDEAHGSGVAATGLPTR